MLEREVILYAANTIVKFSEQHTQFFSFVLLLYNFLQVLFQRLYMLTSQITSM